MEINTINKSHNTKKLELTNQAKKKKLNSEQKGALQLDFFFFLKKASAKPDTPLLCAFCKRSLSPAECLSSGKINQHRAFSSSFHDCVAMTLTRHSPVIKCQLMTGLCSGPKILCTFFRSRTLCLDYARLKSKDMLRKMTFRLLCMYTYIHIKSTKL